MAAKPLQKLPYATPTPNNQVNDLQNDDNNHVSINKNEFPYKLGPFGVRKANLNSSHFSSIVCNAVSTGCYQIDPQRFKNDPSNKFKILIEFIDFVNNLNNQNDIFSYGILGTISPLHVVTLNKDAKKAANIPKKASYFGWSYPSVLPKSILSSFKNEWLSDSNIIFLTVGGFMYFDKHFKLLQINTLIPAIDGRGLQCSKPKKWNNKYTIPLYKNGRFQEITIASLSKKGAKYFCWLFPNEKVYGNNYNDTKILTKHGGFVYLFHEPTDLSDVNAVKMDRYFEILSGKEFKKVNKKNKKRSKSLFKKQKHITKNGKNSKYWQLSYIEQKKKQIAILKQQLNDNNDVKDNINDHNNSNNIADWDANKVSSWLNDINMSELRIPFFQNNISGNVLFAGINNKNNVSQTIKKLNLSRNDLETIVINQFYNNLVKLNEIDKNKELLLKNKINKLQSEIESIQNEKICLICYTNNKNMLIKPCNHVCCCNICIKDMKKCPLCNQNIASTEKIYN